MEHLSEAWIDAFDAAVRSHEGLRAATAEARVVIRYTVDATEYSVVLDHGDNRVLTGAAPDPDITLHTDRRTASAIAHHDESAQTAFMAGRLRLGGDVRVLIANQAIIAGIDDCAAELRAMTDGAPSPAGVPDA